MSGTSSILSGLAIVFSLISMLVSIVAIVIVLAQRWSTHKIEWKPMSFEPITDKEEEEIDEGVDQELKEILLKAKKMRDNADPMEDEFQTNNF